MQADVARLRHRYARQVTMRLVASDERLRDAFAAVPRERFVGPGPWRLVTPFGSEMTPDADLRHVYSDIAIECHPVRGRDDGEPSLHALGIAALGLGAGQAVAHAGCGTGYYSAVMAELVGGAGRVDAHEDDRVLAERARSALAPWPQASVTEMPSASLPAYDAVYCEAAGTGPDEAWLAAVKDGGRIVFPLTDAFGRGALVCLSRRGDVFAVAPLARVTVTPPALPGGAGVDARLAEASAAGRLMSVRALYRGAPSVSDPAVVRGDGWWLSSRPLDL
ncbi:protein-L-isoaspartate(D-aspartate) O-methyltransferase [Chelatococcus caeni]|uniref:Protein-L-isoaspartate O-methyltransferase n=1 Tax=Chelatococcus caeni TaxID=1348468 RepID=A0A840BW80_9HYPH|nr:protein-L-isoaspartate(D-aspartate) O-methyltransferase [Chelatococcus caeni]